MPDLSALRSSGRTAKELGSRGDAPSKKWATRAVAAAQSRIIAAPANGIDAAPAAAAAHRCATRSETMICSQTIDEVATHSSFLLTRARRICRNDADARDLVQDTCLHAIEALKRTGITPDNVRAWLIVIMRNQWLSSMRQQRVRVNAHAELATRPAVDDATVESRIVPDQLVRAWNRLPAHSQHIARQHLIDGCSQEELSRRLGMTAGGVAASIHRTRDALRRAMRELTSAFELETI